MHASLHDLWGCGRGPVLCATPPTRLVGGASFFAACLVSTGATLTSSLYASVICAAWLVMCRPPWKVVRASLALGLALFLPYFLLLPLLPDAPSAAATGWRRALVVPWTILLRGLGGMLVCASTVASLSTSDLREALLRLPVPRLVSAILLQIVHQTVVLSYETRQIMAAMAVRGASGGGHAAWRVLYSLPRVWLPRVIVRAERVGAAMELRGYGDCRLPSFPVAMGLVDFVVLGVAAAILVVAIAIRVLDVP
jgi:energy-coupling factor transporter transmembrane protein EcfT